VPNPSDQPPASILGVHCADMESMQDDFFATLGAQIKILLAADAPNISAVTPRSPHSSASFALDRLTMWVRLPSGRLIRYIQGHFGSATMRGSSLGGLRDCFSMTLRGICPWDIPTGAVTLRTGSGATPGRVVAGLTGDPRSRVRCAVTRHRGLQKRAVDRRGLNCKPQAEQAMLIPMLMVPARSSRPH